MASPPRPTPSKMRATRQRPTSRNGPTPQTSMFHSPTRKVFNCIADDSALVAGVKKSTRNGIRQWVKNGQIRLFVPLHALEELNKQKSSTNRHGEDVRETLQWLDEATSKFPNFVTLQGGDETYDKFSMVENFVVPRTLFSENDVVEANETAPENVQISPRHISDLTSADAAQKTSVSSIASVGTGSMTPSPMRSQRSSISAVSPPTSPAKAVTSPMKPAPNRSSCAPSSSSSVPQKLQPLLNYIIWRIHQEANPVAALESFIFLCNDAYKVSFANGFEIKTKRLEQLRDAIGREDRDYKNRQMVLNRESSHLPVCKDDNPEAVVTPEQMKENEIHQLMPRSPPTAPAAMLAKPQRQSLPIMNMMDPDAFGRPSQNGFMAEHTRSPRQSNASRPAQNEPMPGAIRSPRLGNVEPQSPRGDSPMPFNPRGNTRGNIRGSQRGRANFAAGPGRGNFPANNRASTGNMPTGQIDPHSFVRPRAGGSTGRGGQRKLWVPAP